MMTAVIFFFSGTGNTYWCANRLADSLTECGIATRAISIEEVERTRVEYEVVNVEIVGLGWPVYASDLPEPMKWFIDSKLPECDGRRLFTFCTQLMFSGNGARVYESELLEKHWEIGWSAHFIMPNNICVTAFRIPYKSEPAKHSRRLERTGVKIDRFARALATGKRYARGRSRFSEALGYMQRGPYRKWFPSLRDDIAVDEAVCTRCGRCVDNCPAGNLTLKAGHIVARGLCVLCVRCYNFCPVQAVRYRGKPHLRRRGIPYRGPIQGFRPELLTDQRNRRNQ